MKINKIENCGLLRESKLEMEKIKWKKLEMENWKIVKIGEIIN